MSSIPTLKRQVATSQDECERLIQKVIKYSKRLQNELNSWRDQREASDVRQHMRSLFCEPSVEVICKSIVDNLSSAYEEEEEEDWEIYQSNIITGKRKRKKPEYYVDDHFEELMFEDVPDEEEMHAAIEEDVSEEEKNDDETDEEWTPDEQGLEDYDEY